ncbi:NUDIX domain-containing protein [Actinomycetospora chlora]|uniref:NUDIX domain-containing protein n=1 Tax=Actinomycetospora chlora TaxID=663608 RepID=A0ABP9A6Y3_9PSEU
MNSSPLHSVSVAGVTVDDQGRVLLVRRRDNGQWQAPGGVLELEERFEGGVVREVLEETGVRVEVERLSGVYKNLSKGVVALVYRCHPIGGTAQPTDESVEVAWLTVEDALNRMSPAFAVRVTDALNENVVPPGSRAHDGHTLL